MIKKSVALLCLLVPLIFASTTAQGQGTGMVREVYACNYFEGKDRSDLMAARDYMIEHSEMGDLALVPTFLWEPLKTDNELDFLWFNEFESIEQFGQEFDEYLASPHGQMIQARFDEIVDCGTGLVTHTQIHDGGNLTVNPPAFVSSAACRLRGNHSLEEVTAAVGRFTDLIDDIGSHSESTVFMQIPLVSSTGMDVYFFAVFDDASAWAAADAAVAGSSRGAVIGAEFQSLMRCNTSLWTADIIVQGN